MSFITGLSISLSKNSMNFILGSKFKKKNFMQ